MAYGAEVLSLTHTATQSLAEGIGQVVCFHLELRRNVNVKIRCGQGVTHLSSTELGVPNAAGNEDKSL